jgi:DNA-3-methyladenine glycosylase
MRMRGGKTTRIVRNVRIVRPVRNVRIVRVVPHSFYARPTLQVAEELLGKVLVHRTREGTASGVIVETEAYIGEDDPACHASFGRTQRSEPLFGPPGFAYVYLNYGVHYLMNAVTEADGYPGAVLIRALQPLEGIELMKNRRVPNGHGIDEHDLCRGPGNLTKALGITIKDNRLDLTTSRLTIDDRGISVGEIATGPRIGIRVAVERPWRYWVEGHRSVSAHRRSTTKPKTSRR